MQLLISSGLDERTMVASNLKSRRDAYVGVRADDGRRSSILHVWTRRGQVYVAAKGQGGVDKISFHSPTYCQHAFNENLKLPDGMPSRQTVIWQRSPTPPLGLLSGSCGFTWQVPTDTLSFLEVAPPEGVQWIAAKPSGKVTILDMVFTVESEVVVTEIIPAGSVVLFWPVSAEESFFIRARSGGWDRETTVVPADHREHRHLVISGDDPENTGRPVRFSVFNRPTDGQALVGWDFGGYWTDKPPKATSTFSRKTVVASGSLKAANG